MPFSSFKNKAARDEKRKHFPETRASLALSFYGHSGDNNFFAYATQLNYKEIMEKFMRRGAICQCNKNR